MASVSFILNSIKGTGTSRVRMRVRTGDGRVQSFEVPYRVNPQNWVKQIQRCRKNTVHEGVSSSVINSEIARMELVAENVLNTLRVAFGDDSAEGFRQQFLVAEGKSECREKYDINGMYNRFILERSAKKNWTEGTLKKHKTVRNHTREYVESSGKKQIDEGFIDGLIMHLSHTLGLRNDTVNSYVKIFKEFAKWLDVKGKLKYSELFYDYKPMHISAREVVYLEWDELMSVYNHDFTKGYLSNVRDIFCFCCFTGLRFSDVRNMKKSDIREDYFVNTNIKTGRKVNINYNKYARAIIERHIGTEGENLFCVPSNQKTNKYIHEMAEECGLDGEMTLVYYKGGRRIEETRPKYELVTTHCGRRTFICNALSMGISPNIVMKWTGHSNYSAMKPYIDIADKAKADAMALFDKR